MPCEIEIKAATPSPFPSPSPSPPLPPHQGISDCLVPGPLLYVHIIPLLVDFSRLLYDGVQLLVCVTNFLLCTCYIILGREGRKGREEERRGGGKRGERGEERRREEREGEEKLSLTLPHEILNHFH